MDTKDNFLQSLADYSNRTGMKPEVVCVAALNTVSAGNLPKRIKAQTASLSSIARVEQWMRAFPDGCPLPD